MSADTKTKIVGIFGYPIKHTASPAMHNAAYEFLGINYRYTPFEVPPEKLEEEVKSMIKRNICGANVTIPHKETIKQYLDKLTEEAKVFGAVNTVVVRNDMLVGHNTDGIGFAKALDVELGVSLKGKNIVILGGGGAARAISIQSALEGANKIVFATLASELKKVKQLAKRVININKDCVTDAVSLDDKEKLSKCMKKADMLVNATPVGMREEDGLLVDENDLTQKLLVYDIVYNPVETKLLKAATKKGIKTVGGAGMLLYQGVASFEVFTGLRAPVDVMKEALYKFLEGK